VWKYYLNFLFQFKYIYAKLHRAFSKQSLEYFYAGPTVIIEIFEAVKNKIKSVSKTAQRGLILLRS
jgi:hypothetical protein